MPPCDMLKRCKGMPTCLWSWLVYSHALTIITASWTTSITRVRANKACRLWLYMGPKLAVWEVQSGVQA
jgi:hypothetical protein